MCLFENYKKQPRELSKVVGKYIHHYNNEAANYNTTEKFLKAVEKIGYTFDYGLCNEPFNLRKL